MTKCFNIQWRHHIFWRVARERRRQNIWRKIKIERITDCWV